MPDRPGQNAGQAPSRPSPAEAEHTLRELQAIGDRSRRIAYGKVTRTPLLLWGVGWGIGYAALDLLPWTVAVPLGFALSVAAVLSTWLSRSEVVVNGWERRTRLSWLVLMASSPLLVATISPVPAHTVVLFLGALWGVALLLYAVAAGDLPLGVVGAVIVIAAMAVRLVGTEHRLLVFGVVAGGAMAALGVRRMGMPG